MLLLFRAVIRCNPSRWRPFYLSPEITDKTTFGAKLECNLSQTHIKHFLYTSRIKRCYL